MSAISEDLGQRVTRAEALARRLESDIRSHALTPGARIGTKRELRERFGVALQTVNEALRLMESRGLVSSRPGPGGGVFVADTDAQERTGHMVIGTDWEHATVGDYVEVRAGLEPLICRQAARHASADDVAELDACVDLMDDSLTSPQDYLRANWEFHRRVAMICQNVPLRSTYLTMLDFLQVGLDDFEFDRTEQRSIRVHRALVAAIAGGEGRRLETAIRRHAEQSPLPG